MDRPGGVRETAFERPGERAFTPCDRDERSLQVLVIGASTGGPQALEAVIGGLGYTIASLSVLVVLHMPAEFVEIVVQHVGRLSGRPTHIAADGAAIERGHIYVSPGDVHLEIVKRGGRAVMRHSKAAPVNFCRPSIDVLFRSAAQTFGERSLGLILTGMGRDGLEGARALVAAGAKVLAQDQATSVVWGMPGVVAAAGLAHAVVPIGSMASHVRDQMRRAANGGSGA